MNFNKHLIKGNVHGLSLVSPLVWPEDMLEMKWVRYDFTIHSSEFWTVYISIEYYIDALIAN